MDYYTIDTAVAGQETKADIYNKLLINTERLAEYNKFYGALYKMVGPAVTIPLRDTSNVVLTFEPSSGNASKIHENIDIMDKQNFDRYKIPKGFFYARINAHFGYVCGSAANQLVYIYIYKNNSLSYYGLPLHIDKTTNGYGYVNLETPWLQVYEGDFFQLIGRTNSNLGSSIVLNNQLPQPSYEYTFGIELKK